MCKFFRAFLLLAIIFATALPLAASDDFRLHLNYATFDPKSGEPGIPAALRSAAVPGETNSYLVQFDGPVQDAWKADLSSAGAQVIAYIPNFAFLVKMTPETAKSVQSLSHVRWVGIYHAAYKIDKKLFKALGKFRVKIKVLKNENQDKVRAKILQLSGISAPGLKAGLSSDNIKQIAKMNSVEWIEPQPEYRLLNDVARGVTGINTIWNTHGIYGSGEIVAVCDTGLDTGELSTLSPDFAGRVIKTYNLGRNDQWSDIDGHGTHTCGTILGNGSQSGSNPASHNYAASFAGVAPEAQLVMQSILDYTGGLSGLPNDLNDLFAPAYNDGARIHSNSWGSEEFGVYTTDAQNVDLFTWNHKDMAIVFSAGNSGADVNRDGVVDSNSMGSPATAKNCISVGASENLRLTIGFQGTYNAFRDANNAVTFQTNPIYSDKVSDNTSGIAAFSSRGPTNDGRIKPDVVAPGTNILSCRSHASGAGTGWGVYSADYMFDGGTSMSGPLVAGATAIIRQYYRTLRGTLPSSALLKATLINSATDIRPGQYGTGLFLEIPTARPNNVEGWGLVNPSYAIAPTAPRSMNFVENTPGLATGGSSTYTYAISGNPSPFRITLVWTDYPAATSASKALVNDLDLTVIAPNLTLYRGNGSVDRTNNVECVDIANPVPGEYIVQVTAHNIPFGPQPFALVTTAAFGPVPPKAVIDAPIQSQYLFGQVAIMGTASGADFQQYKLDYGAGASPSTWLPIGTAHTTPVVSNVLQIWDTSSLANGVYTVRLTSTSGGGVTSSQVTVNVLKTTIISVKGQSDGSTVTITGKVISAGAGAFDGFMYIQEPNRLSGIRVNATAPADALPGSLVTVTGTLTSIEGERAITNPNLTITVTKP